ncbi:N-acetyl-gamma-glutamyl-phosphate reductase [Archaeoglobus veneficus]|uniref:N-acetyl-gamma-glutamyl-phosphate reductase n=1 Tax=Archaeoglobus veneficus (strain DSM 11195 / SNP6) TaxID=693661 RepID=F2KQT7_ARCVS|nr:N-acetyl-gamma-glutamyl-phosphate reductase [Archaeoglobus veneficus]AEA46649.1 N-acetyl-gamma-glutamyl-phosphate reductase [Archaeoglobus veneficus SNP6]
MVKVGIVGGSGYTGSELLRLLYKHPKAEVVAVTSRKWEGKPVWECHPFLKGFCDLTFVSPEIKNFDGCDIVFTAVPHGEAMKYVPQLLDVGIKVVDLSADYRLQKDVYEKAYGLEHEAYREAVYGLPELHRDEVAKADLVANPGCYPTGCILAAAPLAKAGLIERVVFDSKSGITGAGIKPTEFTHYPNLHEAIVPYKVTNHRHYYEMVQEIGELQDGVKVSFTPQVFPGSRGILTNAHIFLKENVSLEEVRRIYEEFYKDCYFVRMQNMVRLSWVRGSNFCDIAVFAGEDRVVVSSAIDNLVKGASGQAIQNMNIMLGFDEKEGLDFPPLFP